MEARKIAVKDVEDWHLVCLFCHWRPPNPEPELPRRVTVDIHRAVWDRQDGYGAPGFTPIQGWDWSGIRDSTPEAKAEMAAAIRERLEAEGIEELTVTDAEPEL